MKILNKIKCLVILTAACIRLAGISLFKSTNTSIGQLTNHSCKRQTATPNISYGIQLISMICLKMQQ